MNGEQRSYNRLLWELQASEQAVLDRDVELHTARPMAAAAYTFCSVFLDPQTNGADVLGALAELLKVHSRQTPGPERNVA